MSKSDSIRTVTLKLTEVQHRLLCNTVRQAVSEIPVSTPQFLQVSELYEDIVVNGPAFHTTPEVCTHPLEFQRQVRRWPTLDMEDVSSFYAEYVCDICDSQRTDVEDPDGGVLQEGAWRSP